MVTKIGIIGGGASGALLALHLLHLSRRTRHTKQIYIFEPKPILGYGLAYSTDNFSHVLNVPAKGMSAFTDQPLDFVTWLRERHPAFAKEDCFAPRRLWGEYLASRLRDAIQSQPGHLYHVPEEVISVARAAEGYCIATYAQKSKNFSFVILALGNSLPGRRRYGFLDPWDEKAYAAIEVRQRIFIVGTGLTMVDTVLALQDRGHSGPIYALSRHGLLPQTHGPKAYLPPVLSAQDAKRERLSDLLMRFRYLKASIPHNWRSAMASLRPVTAELWQTLPLPERRSFLRHLQTWWNIHRHLLPPQAESRLSELINRGQLKILRGQIAEAKTTQTGWNLSIQPALRLEVDVAFDCTGPILNPSQSSSPLLKQMLADNLIRPHTLDLGIDVNDQYRAIDHWGEAISTLNVMGPLTCGQFWESTAIPEIRQQAAYLAEAVLKAMG